jgi:hypothetical protein
VSPWSTNPPSTLGPVAAGTAGASAPTGARSCTWAGVTRNARRCPSVSTARGSASPAAVWGPRRPPGRRLRGWTARCGRPESRRWVGACARPQGAAGRAGRARSPRQSRR